MWNEHASAYGKHPSYIVSFAAQLRKVFNMRKTVFLRKREEPDL